MKRFLLFVSLTALFSGCSSSDTKTDIATYRTRFVPVADSVRLEVLDWGGTGQPLVFLADIGNTAHNFCTFAPTFTDQYHVYGITRRGAGQSSVPNAGYDPKTLAHDVLVVLDSLHLAGPILVGHSFAGEELSQLAATYPRRVHKLIYLDAAYDKAGADEQLGAFPDLPRPTTQDSASLASFQHYIAVTDGITIPMEEMRQIGKIAKNGRFTGSKTPGFVFAAMNQNVVHPAYDRIRCPALAIYAKHHPARRDELPCYTRLDTANQRKADAYDRRFQTWQQREMDRFQRQVARGTVKTIQGVQRYLFDSHPAETERLMREFLK